MEKRNILIFLIVLLVAGYSEILFGDTYVVTTTADDGDGSLRWAITEANQNSGADTIVFNIPDSDDGFDGTVWWIRPQTMLPAFYDDSTWVNGQSQTINMGNRNTKGPEIIIYGGDITDPNQAIGFLVMSSNNTISGLVISGFASFGIRFRNDTAKHNEIWGNYIGTDPAGENAMGNLTGIYISRSAGSTIIGGGGEERRNIISGNIQNGIYTVVSDSNIISGNYIGTDPSGTFSIPNGSDGKHSGIWISYGKHNIIGGSDADTRNIISGNGRDAIHMTYADSNIVIGNYIGVDVTGTVLLANGIVGVGDGLDIRYGSSYNIIGGTNPGERNVVCGSPNMGIRIGESDGKSSTDHNIVLGNYVGTDVNGEKSFGCGNHGIYLLQDAKYNIIGSDEPGGGNVVSANVQSGIAIKDAGADSNIIAGNIIGLTVSGDSPLPNGENGVLIFDSSSYNTIGPGNVISGNLDDGIEVQGDTTTGNIIYGNIIGLNSTGEDSIPNYNFGIHILTGADNNIVGSSDISTEGRNIISGNRMGGVLLDSTFDNTIAGNFIGTDISGENGLANGANGILMKGAGNLIKGNLISGNRGAGICIFDSSYANVITENTIGASLDLQKDIGNNESGIFYQGQTSAQKDSIGPSNNLLYNRRFGVEISDSMAFSVYISENSITKNDSGGILLNLKANKNIGAPVITQSEPVKGTAPSNAVIEVYSDSDGQGSKFEGRVIADNNGDWTYEGSVTGPNVTAVAIDQDGNTSCFSNPYSVTPVIENSKKVADFSLSQNYPNPFNPETSIRFSVAERSHVKVDVYNVKGQVVATLTNQIYEPGSYRVTFNAGSINSGVYVYKIKAGEKFSAVKKMLFLK